MSHGAEISPGAASIRGVESAAVRGGIARDSQIEIQAGDRILMNPASPSAPIIRGWAVATILAPEWPAPAHGMQALISYRMTRRL